MARVIGLITLLGFCICGNAQQFEAERITTWDKAGPATIIAAPTNVINIMDFGANNDGTISCNSALESAILSLNGAAGTIYFPEGEYLFESTINLTDSIFLKGESNETLLTFDLGGSGNCIQMNGSISSQEYPVAQNALKGNYEIELADASLLQVSDYIRISGFDEDYMFSSWAYGTLGQLVQVIAIDGNTLHLADPLNHNYPLSRNPIIKKVNPIVATGVECLKINREDATAGQTDNILMNYATNCVVRNIESTNCNFGHVVMQNSFHNIVEGSFFHHAHGYGGGGQGYGVVTQITSCFNLIQDNIFEHLRHSMLVQAGANANVFGYNYSTDPYWEDGFLPSNSAGDAVLHGNYTTMNLFEGNVIQNIVVDASHGSNGPFNTFFRNRAELYGFFSDSGTPTDSMNVVGNEITNSGFPYGLFALNGSGHYSFGNNHFGTVTPQGTGNLEVNTLYLNELVSPPFLINETLPMIGIPLAMNEKTIPAEIRFENEDYVNCSNSMVTGINSVHHKPEMTPYLSGMILHIPETATPSDMTIYSTNGQLLWEQKSVSTQTALPNSLSNGVYVIQCRSTKDVHNIKVLISR